MVHFTYSLATENSWSDIVEVLGWSIKKGFMFATDLNNSIKAFEELKAFLREEMWAYEEIKHPMTLYVKYQAKNTSLKLYLQIREKFAQFLCYSVFPIKIPTEKRLEIAEFICRVNYTLPLGNFDIDFTDGELRYKSSIDFGNTPLNQVLIKHALYPCIHTMDRYYPNINIILNGDQTPLEASKSKSSK